MEQADSQEEVKEPVILEDEKSDPHEEEEKKVDIRGQVNRRYFFGNYG